MFLEVKNIKNELKYYIKKFIRKDINKWSLCIFNYNRKKLIFSHSKKKINDINIFKPPEDEFWADPFLFKYKKKKFIFFEKFLKKKNKGIISVATIKNNEIYKIDDILKKNYHLSYPFILRHNKNIYLIPESYQAKKMQIYICKKFPTKWELLQTHFNNEIISDPTFFKYKKSLWFFVNKTNKNLIDLNKNLYLFKMSNNLTKIIPHKENPVRHSNYGGRSAGPILKIKNEFIRPAQIQKKNNYGYGLVFFKIFKLNLNKYLEKKISSLGPNLFENTKGIHHISNINDTFIVDLNLKN